LQPPRPLAYAQRGIRQGAVFGDGDDLVIVADEPSLQVGELLVGERCGCLVVGDVGIDVRVVADIVRGEVRPTLLYVLQRRPRVLPGRFVGARLGVGRAAVRLGQVTVS